MDVTVADLQSALAGRMLRGHPRDLVTGPKLYFLPHQQPFTRSLYHSLVKRRLVCLVVPSDFPCQESMWSGTGISLIQVTDTQLARRTAASYLRQRLQIPVIQVIGSAGKTTTKAMIRATLRKLHPVATQGSLNDTDGVVNTLLCIGAKHGAAIVEAGMTEAGHMQLSSSMIRPDILVLTSIQSAHLVRLGSIAAITAAKAEAIPFVSPHGLIVINGEDQNCANFPVSNFPGRVLRYGFSKRHDVWASAIKEHNFQTDFVAHVDGQKISCHLATFGRYNIGNALAAICVGHHLGLHPQEIAEGLASFCPVRRRLRVQHGHDGIVYIDDNFNANPESTRQLLDALLRTARRRRLILVLGDVERPNDAIAEYARSVHYDIGRQVAWLDPAHLIAIGKWAREYVAGAASAGYSSDRMAYFHTPLEAKEHYRQLLRPGDVVVFKASVYMDVRRLLQLGRKARHRPHRGRWSMFR